MTISRAGVAFFLSVLAAGCSIRPVPEDVTGVSTYTIVRQIRCEARAAVIRSGLGWLTNDKQDAETRRIGLEFVSGSRGIDTLDYKLFRNDRIRKILRLFADTGIAYNYSLVMSETNDLGGGVNLLRPFSDARGTIGLSANANRRRQNTRAFTVTDTFSGLLRQVSPKYCDDHVVDANHLYPIAGKIGMEPMIREFIELTLFTNLSGAPKGPPTLVDALEFETTLDATANPKIVFTPTATALNVLDASLTSKLGRKDLHKVTVGLAVAEAVAGSVAPVRDAVVGALLTASGGPTEKAAATAVNQVLTSQLFSRITVIER